jgi:hypothetical protein
MITWSQLVLPILLSGVAIFIASTLIHTVVRWHSPDYKKLSNEDEVTSAIRRGSPAAAQYNFPHCPESQKSSPEMKAKFAAGPVGVMYLREAGEIRIGPFLLKWFVYLLVVAALVGYVAMITLGSGASYLNVFRVVSATAWLAFAWQGPGDSIWVGKPWGSTVKYLLDGLIYALLMAGVFGWLWPR